MFAGIILRELPMQTINIFLASSSELKAERDAFRLYVGSQNDIHQESKNTLLRIVHWENYIDAVALKGKQAEYNESIETCHMVVCLFHRKAGQYTVEEFETALDLFRKNGRPLIYTYFKGDARELEEAAETDEEAAGLLRFRSRLEGIKHYYNQFSETSDLLLHFRTQLDLLENKGFFLPDELYHNLVRNVGDEPGQGLHNSRALWVKNLRSELLKQGAVVGETAAEIFQHYGWLVQTFLIKLCTGVGVKTDARRLSFMAEAFQSSMRYLCCIQAAQLLESGRKYENMTALSQFLQMRGDEYMTFDYLALLRETTAALPDGKGFMPEIARIVDTLSDPDDDLAGVVSFMDIHRRKLVAGDIPEDADIGGLLDQYLTALVYWVRIISFLSKYRLISVKDINLMYRAGMGREESKYRHTFGELHGVYSGDTGNWQNQYVQNNYTFNQSVLLVRGNNIQNALLGKNDILSLSPLLADKSVMLENIKQTPELYYFTGRDASGAYRYAHYNNELSIRGYDAGKSNNFMQVRVTNENAPLLDELYDYIVNAFKPFKRPGV